MGPPCPVSVHPSASNLPRAGCTTSAPLSVVFPAGCRICDRMLTEATRIPICNQCLGSFQQILGTVCDKCGTPVEGAPAENQRPFICPRCTNPDYRSLAFDRVRSWSFYDGAMVQAILFLKFENIDPLGELFARLLAEMAVLGGPAFEADGVVPVPLHRRRQRERGYNQTALIAKPLARRLGLPYKSVLLTRIRPRPESICSLSMSVGSPFVALLPHVRASQVDNLRVLLVDDVMTTGATLDSCAKTLRDAGAKSVTGLTVARARLRNAAEHLR